MCFLFISTGEIVLILFVVLLFFGAKAFPTMAKMLGKLVAEYKKVSASIQQEANKVSDTVKENIPKEPAISKEIEDFKDEINKNK